MKNEKIKDATKDDLSGKASVASFEEKGERQKDKVLWHIGVCKWFNSSNGWGFINIKDYLEDKMLMIRSQLKIYLFTREL